jgi:hypothetical protein
MKKFSSIVGEKINKEPKVDNEKINEEDLFKAKVMKLMDDILSIRTYGPIDRYLRAGNIKISGKEMFLESLMDLIKEKNSNKEKVILESLKHEIKDWEILDNKIEKLEKELENIKEIKKLRPYKNKLKSLYNNYDYDHNLILKMIKESCNKISNSETAYLNALAAEYMINENKYPNKLFSEISKLYKNRYNELV